jgi:N-hydroxyarylamine O-acetyltransferase
MSIDLDAYLKRIGYIADRKPTLETLRAVHALHPQTIAFENLSPLLGHAVPLDPSGLHEKMVRNGRGGYCYEQNLLFASALEAIGFKFRHLTGWARWGLPPGVDLPRSHLLLLIDIDGEEWLADVGFGGNTMTSPLRLHSDAEQPTAHEPARIVRNNGSYMVQVKPAERWADLVRFDLGAPNAADLEMGNWFTSTHPKSRFKNELLAARTDTGRRYGLRNNELAEHRIGGPSTRRKLTGVAELRDALTDLFRIKLPDDPALDPMLARFAGMP